MSVAQAGDPIPRLDAAASNTVSRANLRAGVIWMVAAMVLYTCVDTCVKLSAGRVPIIEVVWFRFLVHFLVAAIFLNPWSSPASWRVRNWPAQLFRAAIQIVTAGLSFLALGHLQLAQTTTIQFTTPMLVTVLSIIFLKETVGWSRWAGIAVAFCGVLVVTRPGFDSFEWAFLASIGSVIVGAGYNIMTRRLAPTESSGSLLLMVGAVPALVLAPIMPVVWVTPSGPPTWALLVAVGLFAAAGHYCLIVAHRLAPASFLAPLQYVQFLAVLVSGYFVFHDAPTVWTMLGAGIVVASGLLVLKPRRG